MSFTVTQTTPSKNPSTGWNPNWATQLPTQESVAITPKFVSPDQEGTSASFGGTSGLTDNPTTDDKLPTLPQMPDKINVLKNKTLFSFSDYNTLMLSRENNKLHNLNKHANQYLLENANSKRFFHLPIGELINRTVLTIVAIFVDILNLMKPEEQNKMMNMNFQEKSRIYANVFIQKERLVYFGIFLIFLSLLFMVVFLSS